MKIRRIVLTILAAITLPAIAQTALPVSPGIAPGTQGKLQRGEPLLIGVRGSSSPLAYKSGDTYIGLAVDLCLSAFEQVKKQYPQATYQFVEVNPSNRIDFLKLEKIDMECGSTTNTATRRNEVNFSTPFYYASIVALKLKSNPITSIADVDENSKVIYTEKTTTEQALAGASRVFENKSTRNVYQRVIGKTYDQSFDLLTSGAGDFFAADDILLFSLKEKSKNPENYVFLKDKFSIEPYGIMTRKSDSWLTTIVDKTIIGMMRNGEFNELYDKWFMKPISPSNKALNIPMSRLLKDNVRMPSNIVGN